MTGLVTSHQKIKYLRQANRTFDLDPCAGF